MVKYSLKPIIFSLPRADNSADLRADIHSLLIAAGWQVTSTLTEGYIYNCTSPQGFQLGLLVQDGPSFSGVYDSSFVIFQLQSFDGTLTGYQNALRVGPTWGPLQAIAGICYLWVSTTSTAGSITRSFACAVPYVQDTEGPCSVTSKVTLSQIAWACGGSTNGISFFGHTITDFRFGPNAFAGASYLYNTTMTIWTPDNSSIDTTAGMLCLLTLMPLHNFTTDAEWNQSPVTIMSETETFHDPIPIDALVAWNGQIQGQLYDAFIKTGPGTLDQVITSYDTDANGNPIAVISMTWHTAQFSQLQLVLTPGNEGVGNIAY